MALWQYVFNLIPEGIMENESLLDEEGWFDPDFLWKRRKENLDIFNEIKDLLPLSRSWSEYIIQFGNLESNCMEIYRNDDDDFISSASFRIDFRTDYVDILRKILQICESNKILALNEEFEIMPFELYKFCETIENSRQKKMYLVFLNN